MRSDRTATLPLATVAAAGASDMGRQRDSNEDRFYVDAAQGIFLVVDGVGGEAAGEVAAGLAVETILDRLARQDGPAETRIREAITLANQQILHSAQVDPGRKGMACVLTLAVLEGRQLTIGHVGDSRLYKLTPQGIAKLTHDHSPVGEREDARELTETQAMQHSRRNEVYRDVGSESREPDAAGFIEIVFSDLAEDSAILLCSDGLSDMVTSLEINRLVRLHAGEPEAAVRALIAAANDAGGKDNITVILAEGREFAHHTPATPIVFPPPPEPASPATVEATLPRAAEPSSSVSPEPQRGPEQPVARDTAPAHKARGPFARILGSRGLALVAGALLGVSAALVPGFLEKPSGGRRLVVGGPTAQFTSISAALARAESGDVVLVEPGEYAERLDLPAGVELVSRVPDAAVLVAEPTAAPWVSVTAKAGPGALRGFRFQGKADGTIYIAVRLQGDGFEIDNATFDGAIDTAVEIQERAGGSVLRGNEFNVTGVPVRLGGAISPMLRRNQFVAPADTRIPAVDVGPSATPRLDDNVFVRFTQPMAPMRRDLSLQGNIVLPPGGPAMTDSVFPLDDYEAGELIGQGQFGEVRRAHWKVRGIDVALKKIAASANDAVNKIKAEQRGAELQQLLGARHQGLVPELYQDGLDGNGDYYIAMERIAGQSLADVIKNAPRPSRETGQMGLALADFLRKLHALPEGDDTAEPIIHSDLKPDHVLVLPDGSIRVLDLGIAKTLRANRALTVNFWASAPYASPERLEDGNVRLGDDLWAVGVMLFEMACREHPYQAYIVDDNNAALARAIRRSDPQGPIHSDCDEHLAAIIRKMLAPQPSHRYQTADEVAADLTRYLDGSAPLAAAESARASSATQVIPAPTSRQFRPLDTVPTDPLPLDFVQPAAVPEPAPPAAPRRFPFTIGRPAKTALRGIGAFVVLMIILAQGAAWVRTERLRDRLGRIEATDIERLRTDIKRIQDNAPFPSALTGRLRRSITDRMVLIADRPIHDFRQDLFVSQLQWQEAQRSLALAAEFDGGDQRLAAKTALVDGHLTRIAARENSRERQKRLSTAMSRFIESARLDSSSPDPYLGQARINAYDLHDLDALTASLAEAEKRGYVPGRRERTQLGDTLRYRADRTFEQAARAPFEDRRRLLGQAGGDYEACVTKFEGLTDYHDAEKVLAYCQGRRGVVQRMVREMDVLLDPGAPDASSDR